MSVFVKAVDTGSFTAAGVALGLSSQMVGKHVLALEKRLGAPLLRRTTRRQSLTEAGQAFYGRCRTILAEAESADAVVQELSTTPRGNLRVSAPLNFGAFALAPVVTQFLRDYPGVEVELLLTDRYVDIVDEGFDAVFRLGPIDVSNLSSRELIDHDQIACASPSYLKERGTPAVPDDLLGHSCLGYINWSGRHYNEWRFTKDDQIHGVRVQCRFWVNDGRVLLNAAIAGQGIVLQPSAVLREAISAGLLIPILTDYCAPSRPMYLMFDSQRTRPLKLRYFIDRVIDAFGRSTSTTGQIQGTGARRRA